MRAIRQRQKSQPIDWTKLKPEQLAWTISAERMKGKNEDARAHLVPLTLDVLQILESLPLFKKGDYLFSTTFGEKPVWIGDQIKKEIDARMLRTLRALARLRGDDPAKVELAPWVNHDIRRTIATFRDCVSQRKRAKPCWRMRGLVSRVCTICTTISMRSAKRSNSGRHGCARSSNLHRPKRNRMWCRCEAPRFRPEPIGHPDLWARFRALLNL